MRIQHNIAALNSYRQLGGNNNAVAKNLEKLSSGYKINRAGDDAAGLAISEKMRAQITGLETAQKNAQDGISLVQTAEGALTEVHSMLNRMVELATQSSNGTYSDTIDRENLQAEVDSLRDEINRISESTNFNGINLLDGSLGGPKKTESTGDVLGTSGFLGGKATAATPASGNKFTIDAAGVGALTGTAGNKAGYVELTYTDEKGTEKTKNVKFMTAADGETTAKNLATAINQDQELKNVFQAQVDKEGKFIVEGKQTGVDAKSKLVGIKVLADPAKANKNNAATKAGVNQEYKLAGAIQTGTKIEIDGVEYSFDAAYAGSTPIADKKFKSFSDLKAVFGAHDLDISSVTDNGTSDLTGKTLTDLVIKDSGNKYDASAADVAAVKIKLDGTAETQITKQTGKDGVKAIFTLDAFKDLPAGIERELDFKYNDGNGSETLTLKVIGGKTDAETAQNIKKALDAAMKKPGKLKDTFEDFDITAETNGSIKFTAKHTGVNPTAAVDVTSIEVKDANDIAGKKFDGESKAGLDTHIDLSKPFQQGDTVTIGQHTYTFDAAADGTDGKTFADFESLKIAAKENGTTLIDQSENDDHSAIVAKSASKFTFDFDGRVGADMIGATIDFGGTKFKFTELGKAAEVAENTVNVEIAKDATAEEIADALSKVMKATTKVDPDDEASADVNWEGAAKANKSGKKTIVELTADQMGKVDMPKPKFAGFGINLQVGDTNDEFQKVKVSVDSMDAVALGIEKVDITNQTKAGDSIKMIKDAINNVSAQRGKLGAVQNRLEHTINNLGVTTENITAAESRIRDTDMAREMMAYTKNNILVQSAQAMLAQANTLPQGVLQLLG